MENKDNLREKLVKVIIENRDDYVKLEKKILVTICDDFLEQLDKYLDNYEKLSEEEKDNLNEIDEAAFIMDNHCDKMNKVLAYYVFKRKERRAQKIERQLREGEKILFYDDTDALNDDCNNTNRKN
jgi:phosphopantothenate synthetase